MKKLKIIADTLKTKYYKAQISKAIKKNNFANFINTMKKHGKPLWDEECYNLQLDTPATRHIFDNNFALNLRHAKSLVDKLFLSNKVKTKTLTYKAISECGFEDKDNEILDQALEFIWKIEDTPFYREISFENKVRTLWYYATIIIFCIKMPLYCNHKKTLSDIVWKLWSENKVFVSPPQIISEKFGPLAYAALANNPLAVKKIIEKKLSEPQEVTSNQNTALHFAVQNKNHTIIFDLMMYGSDPHTKNKEGKSAFDFADDETRQFLAFMEHFVELYQQSPPTESHENSSTKL